MEHDLESVIAGATSVRVTGVGEFDARHRSRSKAIFIASNAPSLDRLRRCLMVDERSLDERMALMTPGYLDLNFLVGHELLATVTYLCPGIVRWGGWGADARLLDGAALAAWLAERVTGPIGFAP